MANIIGINYRDKLKQKIDDYVGEGVFDVHYAESDSKEVKKIRKDKKYKYVIKCFPSCKRIIIWKIGKEERCILKTQETIDNIVLEYESCKVFYRRKQKDVYDKIIVISEKFLYDFLEDYKTYMQCNENDDKDIKFDKKELEWGGFKERAKRCIYQKARNCKFRQGVLERYGFQCAICRCDIPQILEAAHERGYEVCRTIVDEVEHGICLCRNHHAMYDVKKGDGKDFLIDINLVNNSLRVNDTRIKQMAWFKIFHEKYQGKLLIPTK